MVNFEFFYIQPRNIELQTGSSTSSASGALRFSSANSATSSSGAIEMQSGVAVAGASGSLKMQVGTSQSAVGNIILSVGNSANAAGSVTIAAGQSSSQTGGSIHIQSGSSSQGVGGSVDIKTGSSISIERVEPKLYGKVPFIILGDFNTPSHGIACHIAKNGVEAFDSSDIASHFKSNELIAMKEKKNMVLFRSTVRKSQYYKANKTSLLRWIDKNQDHNQCMCFDQLLMCIFQIRNYRM